MTEPIVQHWKEAFILEEGYRDMLRTDNFYHHCRHTKLLKFALKTTSCRNAQHDNKMMHIQKLFVSKALHPSHTDRITVIMAVRKAIWLTLVS
jgi:hypothetical protein